MIDKNCGALGINCILAPAAGHSRKSLRTTCDRQGPEITGLERLDWPVSKTQKVTHELLFPMSKSNSFAHGKILQCKGTKEELEWA